MKHPFYITRYQERYTVLTLQSHCNVVCLSTDVIDKSQQLSCAGVPQKLNPTSPVAHYHTFLLQINGFLP